MTTRLTQLVFDLEVGIQNLQALIVLLVEFLEVPGHRVNYGGMKGLRIYHAGFLVGLDHLLGLCYLGFQDVTHLLRLILQSLENPLRLDFENIGVR